MCHQIVSLDERIKHWSDSVFSRLPIQNLKVEKFNLGIFLTSILFNLLKLIKQIIKDWVSKM